MTILVFAGPSLGRATIPDGIRILPPAAEGDLYRAALQRPRAIGLIDGFFEAEPAVWHKEILWAMAEGIPVFGASSMGALRAAELWTFGMRGVGAIFRAYRSGRINDDAEVAVQHGPAELSYPSLNEAMVNVRATLSKAMRAGMIDSAARRTLFAAARAVYYKDRTWDAILDEAVSGGWTGDRTAFRSWVRKNAVDLKRRDALALLALLAASDLAPFQAPYHFEDTTFWRGLVERHQPDFS